MENNLEPKENKAGIVALVCSLLLPIVGVVCYFVKRKEVVDANKYLYAALAGVVLGYFLF